MAFHVSYMLMAKVPLIILLNLFTNMHLKQPLNTPNSVQPIPSQIRVSLKPLKECW